MIKDAVTDRWGYKLSSTATNAMFTEIVADGEDYSLVITKGKSPAVHTVRLSAPESEGNSFSFGAKLKISEARAGDVIAEINLDRIYVLKLVCTERGILAYDVNSDRYENLLSFIAEVGDEIDFWLKFYTEKIPSLIRTGT